MQVITIFVINQSICNYEHDFHTKPNDTKTNYPFIINVTISKSFYPFSQYKKFSWKMKIAS